MKVPGHKNQSDISCSLAFEDTRQSRVEIYFRKYRGRDAAELQEKDVILGPVKKELLIAFLDFVQGSAVVQPRSLGCFKVFEVVRPILSGQYSRVGFGQVVGFSFRLL